MVCVCVIVLKAQNLKARHACDSYIIFNFLYSLYSCTVPWLVVLSHCAAVEINKYSVFESLEVRNDKWQCIMGNVCTLMAS